jgi:hypothetical protein
MKFRSWLRFLDKKTSTRKSRRKTRRSRRVPLQVESLEARELLRAPFIFSVTPADGAVLKGPGSTTPALTITYSEAMNATDATAASNYFLFNANNQPIKIDSVTALDLNTGNNSLTKVLLHYNENNPLPAGSYSLFVQGDQIHDIDENATLALPGQFVVANSATNNVSVVNVSDTGEVGAASNFPDPVNTSATPMVVAFGNISGAVDSHGNPIPDLIVANTSADSLEIFQGQAGGGFSLQPTRVFGLPGNASPSAIAVGDFNNDGKQDIAVADKGTDQVTVFLNTRASPGTISLGAATEFAAGNNPTGLVTADFNQDGNLDLAVSDSGLDGTGQYDVTVLLGDGTGSFGNTNTIHVGNAGSGIQSPTALAQGTLVNSDFRPDIVVAGTNGLAVLINNTATGSTTLSFTQQAALSASGIDSVAVGSLDGTATQGIAATTSGSSSQLLLFKNNGSASFTAQSPIALNAPATSVTFADLNNDGKKDILVANDTTSAPGSVSVLLNQSSGSTINFSSPTAYQVPGAPVSLAVGDTNQDGILDVATANSSNNNDISVLLGKANGTLQVPTNISLGSSPTPVAVTTGDLNGDGIPDLVVVNHNTNQISVLLATGVGTYGSPTTYNVGTSPVAVALGDLLGNGVNDIVVANQGSNTVTVLWNNGSGAFTTSTTLNVGNTPTGVAVGDFNRDGLGDIAVSHNGGTASTSGVTILLNLGSKTFAPGTEVDQGVPAAAIVAADFNNDNKLDLAIAENQAQGFVDILTGNGKGGFGLTGHISTIDHPTSLAVGDLNRDGFLDIVVGGGTSNITSTGNLGALLNTGGSFSSQTSVFQTVHDARTVLGNVAVTDINQDSFPDVVVTIASEGPVTPINNVFVLRGDGQGNFGDIAPFTQPYEVGGVAAAPSYVAIVSDPLMLATSFTIQSSTVSANLVRNPNFALSFLNKQQGLLGGWSTFAETGSKGGWRGQISGSGGFSPLSLVTMPLAPGSSNAAVLDFADSTYVQHGFDQFLTEDEPFVPPIGITGTQWPQDYQGTNILYQDFTIPTTATSLTFSASLFLMAANQFTSSGLVSTLSYTSPAANQQVRIDLVSPTANIEDVGSGVLQNLFQTTPGTPINGAQGYIPLSVDLTPFLSQLAGQHVRLRIATVTNNGKMVVGLSNVQFNATYNLITQPKIIGLRLRNPGFGVSGASAGTTTDQALLGQVLDPGIGSPNDILFVRFDTSGTGTFPPGSTFTINFLQWDANGNFSIDFNKVIPGGLQPGTHKIGVEAIDRAGNTFVTSITFNVLGPSNSGWAAAGPGAISVAGTGVEYPDVSGDVTAVVADPRDPTGNTLYLGAANGGVWKTIDGGKNWTPLTDFVFDSSGRPVPENIGGLGIGASSNLQPGAPSNIIYAATGVSGFNFYDHPGVGVLKSTDAGNTWTVVGQSVFTGAKVSKLVVDPTNADRVYVAVTSGGAFGPGVYGSSDGGATWKILTTPSNMFQANSQSLASSSINNLSSVTDIVINPFNTEDLIIGLGNTGEASPSAAAGVWQTGNFGQTWSIVGQRGTPGIPANGLPSGIGIGRVSLGIGTGSSADTRTWYVMMATPGSAPGAGSVPGAGTFSGFFKTVDFGVNWTNVQLREDFPIPGPHHNEEDIHPLGGEANNIGAIVVDPTDPSIVYLGGSNRYRSSGDANNHGFLRVDTRQIEDSTADNFQGIPGAGPVNNGDSFQEYEEAWTQANPPKFDSPADAYPAKGVGAYWVNLQDNSSGNAGPLAFGDLIPGGINYLTFDSQGRMLVATTSGIYEGISRGFNPGTEPDDAFFGGVVGFELTHTLEDGTNLGIPAFISLNGNLQISNLSSVAVDPKNPNVFYTSQGDTGTSKISGALNWGTMLSLSLPFAPFGEANIPSAAAVRVAPPDPNVPDSFSKVFVAWAFQDRNAGLQVDVSNTAGSVGSFALDSSGIHSQTDNSGQLPPLVINPNDPAGELMFGTQALYETDSGGPWDQISAPSGIEPGAVITAAAFGLSNTDVFYVGTNTGHVYVTLNNGGDGFPLRSTGLPGAPILGLTVDPRNANVAYAMVAGGGIPHVWATTDAGQKWVPISNGLPDVPAFSMAIDTQAIPGAPNGRLYVGTQVGVFVSANGGLTWSLLGQGMPHAPVVDLQFDPRHSQLTAAVQGRGVFSISTDVGGPFVTSISPGTPGSSPLTSLTVTFDKPVNPNSLLIDAETAARGTKVVDVLDHSVSYFTIVVGNYYNTIFGPPSSPTMAQQRAQAVSFWADQLAQGLTTDEKLIALLEGSTFFNTLDDTQWVNKLYLDFTGVAPTPAQKSQALNDLSIGKSRTTVAFTDLLNTPTYQQVLITGFFNQFLKRGPSSQEISDFESQMALGATDENVVTKIVSSPEFYVVNGSRHPLTTGNTPTAVALANLSGAVDFTQTPIPDLIVASNGNTDNLDIYQGLPRGGFSSTPITLTMPLPATNPLPVQPSAIAVGDFNGDGKPDIAVTDQANNQVDVFINQSVNGTISFAPGVGYSAGTGPIAVTTAHLDQSGNLDLVVADGQPDGSNNFDLTLLQGFGDGTFNTTPITIATGLNQLTGVAAGDLNGDNLDDLAVSSQTGLNYYLNQTITPGVFTFGPAQQLVTDINTPTTSVAIGRIDTDNTRDIVATTPANGGQVLIFQNGGGASPTFTGPTALSAGPNPTDVTLNDLLGNGLNDILVANDSPSGTVTILRNLTGKATSGLDTLAFANPVNYQVGENPVGIALGDTNRDGIADFVAVNTGSDDYWTVLGNNDASFQTPTDQSFINLAWLLLVNRLPNSTAFNAQMQNLGAAEQVFLNGPRGRTVPLAINVLDPSTGTNFPFDTTYQLTFAPQVSDGTYTFKLGPNSMGINVRDFVGLGLPQDQNQNLINGENPGDQFVTNLAIASTDDSRFVTGAFHDVLNRAPSNAEFLQYYNAIENQRFSLLSGIATQIVTSTAGRTNLINAIYNEFLGRNATSTELAGWLTGLTNATTTPEQIIANVASLDEYFNTFASVSAYVNAVYQAMLHRAPTSAEATAAATLLGSTPTQAQRLVFTQQLVAGSEFLTDEVQALFTKFLGRYAASSVATYWAGVLAQPPVAGQPARFEQLEIVLLSTREYFLRQQDNSGLSSNVSWLTSLYTKILNSAPDSQFNTFINGLMDGYSSQRTQLSFALTHSTEYYQLLVKNYYQELGLGTPNAQQVAISVQELQSGKPPESVLAELISGPNFFQNRANGNFTQWVNLVFQILLPGTPPSQSMINALNAGNITLAQAANAIVFSTPYLTNFINNTFMSLVGRPALNDELNFWLPRLQNQSTRDQILLTVIIGGSPSGVPQHRDYFPHRTMNPFTTYP